MLDIFNYFVGPFDKFKSYISNNYWKYDIEDDVFAIFKNSKGVIASIHSTAIQWEHKFRIEISLQKQTPFLYVNTNTNRTNHEAFTFLIRNSLVSRQ